MPRVRMLRCYARIAGAASARTTYTEETLL